MSTAKERLIRCMAVVSLLWVEAAVTIPSALATPYTQVPVRLAQQMNGRVATLQCGEFTITIRFVGDASSETYSYQTRGLFLNNGSRDGDDYVFYNNDYEYRVTTTGGGTGMLQVFHYGERILTKQCTWD